MYNVKEENRKNKYQIQTKTKEREGKNKRIDIVIYAKIHNTHTPFHIFSFYLFITTVEIIKLEQHRGRRRNILSMVHVWELMKTSRYQTLFNVYYNQEKQKWIRVAQLCTRSVKNLKKKIKKKTGEKNTRITITRITK